MKKLFSAFVILLLAGCSKHSNYFTFNGFEQGTTYTIVAKGTTEETANRIDAVFDEIDLTFSMFNPASLVSRINRGETDTTTPLFDECFDTAVKVNTLTRGYYDPTVKPLVDAWGFGPGEQQAEPCIECLMEYVGMDKIRIEGGRIVKTDPRVQLDFSSIAKGFTVDKLAEMLESEGVTDYMVEVGGEVRLRGVNAAGRPWRIGIDKPIPGLASRELEEVVSFGDYRNVAGENTQTDIPSSIATSGNYRNQFVDESGRTRVHIVDPLTGTSAGGEILSASIVAASCAIADGWATGIVASQTLERARQLLANASPGIEYYIIYSADDGSTASLHSAGFPLSKE